MKNNQNQSNNSNTLPLYYKDGDIYKVQTKQFLQDAQEYEVYNGKCENNVFYQKGQKVIVGEEPLDDPIDFQELNSKLQDLANQDNQQIEN